MTVTSTASKSETDGKHFLEVTINGESGSVEVCGPGQQCTKGAIDFFILDVDRFGFTESCLRKEDFEGAKLKAASNNGWKPASVYLFMDNCESNELVTADHSFNKWVDGDVPANAEQTLTNK